MEHVRKGSSKDIHTIIGDNGEVTGVYFWFSDRVSVFDVGPLPVLFTGLGSLRCAISGRLFQALNSAGFSTHYLSHDISLAQMHVKPVNIPALIPPVDYGPAAVGTMLPVELLCRRMITEKFLGRIERGEVSQEQVEVLLTSPLLKRMAVMDPPFVECSTKYEAADRYIPNWEAGKLVNQNEQWLIETCYPFVENLFRFFYDFLHQKANFLLVDGKVELAITPAGELMLVDSISPDELGLIDPKGGLADKNILRSYIIKHYPDWHAKLEEAKKLYPSDKSKWPVYPPDLILPQELVEEYVAKTREFAVAIGTL